MVLDISETSVAFSLPLAIDSFGRMAFSSYRIHEGAAKRVPRNGAERFSRNMSRPDSIGASYHDMKSPKYAASTVIVEVSCDWRPDY